MKNKLIAPVVKWVGGKRQLIPEITARLPKKFNSYYEPFIGGGALCFHLQPQQAVINDFNEELINVYEVIKDNLQPLIVRLKKHDNNAEYFYALRSLDRKEEFKNLSAVDRAARIIYLNKTCFNGLYRVNSSGEFNSPFGNYKNPNIVNEPVLTAVSNYLNKNDIDIQRGDYADAIETIPRNGFVYLDPPYHPVSATSNFTGYNGGGFGQEEQVRLKNVCDDINRKGGKFLLSNSAADFIKELYGNYNIDIVKATRSINADGDGRGEVDEVLISNYDLNEK